MSTLHTPIGGPRYSLPQPRLCVVVCYIGPWPNYFPLYLHSCAHNPTVDFLLLSDQAAPGHLPPNVRVEPMTLPAFNQLATAKLGLPVQVAEPFKLCDFKAAYGHIFEDYLEGYDFWVLGDIDLVYGCIPAFWNQETLRDVEILSSRHEFLTGHGTVFRNVPRINRLYQQSPDHARVFQSTAFFSFSECNKLWRHFSNGGTVDDHTPEVQSMTHLTQRLASEGSLRLESCFHIREEGDLQAQRWAMDWDEGRLTFHGTGEELLYFHFHNYKHRWLYHIPRWKPMPTRFRMNRWGFFREPLGFALGRRAAL